MHTEVRASAERILSMNPDPIPQYRILRDVLALPPTDKLIAAKKRMLTSHWIKDLEAEQKNNGSWGPFHSRTTKKSRFYTTEYAVSCGIAYGLIKNDHIFKKAVEYMSSVLQGNQSWEDTPEKNERWPIGVEMITASTLSQIDPYNKILDPIWEKWVIIAEKTFSSGKYNPDDEECAHKEIHGLHCDLQYLRLNNKYALQLLTSRTLPEKLQNALIKWVWHLDTGIKYLEIPLYKYIINVKKKPSYKKYIGRWLSSLELLSNCYTWKLHAKESIDWLLTQKNDLWDFENVDTWRLSENWRRRKNRQIDHSTRVLLLLAKYFQ